MYINFFVLSFHYSQSQQTPRFSSVQSANYEENGPGNEHPIAGCRYEPGKKDCSGNIGRDFGIPVEGGRGRRSPVGKITNLVFKCSLPGQETVVERI